MLSLQDVNMVLKNRILTNPAIAIPKEYYSFSNIFLKKNLDISASH